MEQVVAMLMSDDAGAAPRSSARRRRERRMRAALRHEHGHAPCSGPSPQFRSEAACECGEKSDEEVEATKLPQEAWPEALVSDSGSRRVADGGN